MKISSWVEACNLQNYKTTTLRLLLLQKGLDPSLLRRADIVYNGGQAKFQHQLPITCRKGGGNIFFRQHQKSLLVMSV